MNKILVKLCTFIVLALSFYACQKDFTSEENTNGSSGSNISLDLSTKVIAKSISGFVTDENNLAVMGAIVKIGSVTIVTDKYGYFEAKNTEVVKGAAVIMVSKFGYFNGIKTYIAETGKSAFFRIKLLPKLNAGSFVAASGGTVSVTGGSKIVFPANAIVNASSGIPYSGTVSVKAYWINPQATDLNSIMPGDLRGIDKDNNAKQLTTYGMVAAELIGGAGELLQIASGKKATLSVTIPPAISATAPASIPLWSFDETMGLWKEEGIAVKNGNEYSGEVSHFSFWNYDVPANYIQVNLTLQTPNGLPFSYRLVKISVLNNPANAAYGYTDSAGYVSGAVPNNSQLKLEVYSDNTCGTPLHTQTFSTANINMSLGIISVAISTASSAVVTGTVTNCSNGPVTNGYIIMRANNINYRYLLSSTGSYSFNYILCAGQETATFIGEDLNNNQQNAVPVSKVITSGTNAIPSIQACGLIVEEFFKIKVNGSDFIITSPIDSFRFYNISSNGTAGYGIQAGQTASPFKYGVLKLLSTNLIVGSQISGDFTTNCVTDSLSSAPNANVTITEAGTIGQFVAGNFTVTFTGSPPSFTPYNIIASFRIRRTQ